LNSHLAHHESRAKAAPTQGEADGAGALGLGEGGALRGGALTIASQAVSSATTFLRMVLLARVCSDQDVGHYAMAFTAIGLLWVVHERLIESGYLVGIHRRNPHERSAWLGSTIVYSLWFSVAGAFAIALAALGAAALGQAGWIESSRAMVAALLAAAVVSPTMVFRELARSISFAHFDIVNAAVVDVMTLIVQVLLLLVFWQTDTLTVETAYLAVGVSSLAACLWWAYQWRHHWTINSHRLGADWREMWSFSRWLLAARILGQGSRFIMPWIVAAWLGAAGAGVLAICVTLVGLSFIFVRGVNNYFRPRTVYAFYHGGVAEVRHTVVRTTWAYVAILGAVCGVYAVAGDWLFELASGRRNPDAWFVTLMLGLGTVATSVAMCATNGLAAIDRPRANVWIEGLTFVVTAALALPLVPWFGLYGAAVAMLAGNVAGAIASFYAFERELKLIEGGDSGAVVESRAETTPHDGAAARESISIIVATFNRAGSLARAVECLAAQDSLGAFDLEVIVVDNGSTDDTEAVVAGLAERSPWPVRYCYEPRQGLPFARNRGLHEAAGRWIAFFDDDQLAAPNWLAALHRFAVERGLACVGGGRCLKFEAEPPAALAPYCRKLLGEALGVGEPQLYSRKHLPTTGNALVRRDVIDRLGGFNETWLEGGEDTEFFNRLVSSGVEAWSTPDAVVEHVIPASRLAPDYLERIALRHGVTFGRRDLEEQGRWLLPLGMAARACHAAVLFAPRLLVARLRGDAAAALGWRCRLRRVEGYVRFGLQALAPRVFGQDEFVATMMHRDTAHRDARSESSAPRPRSAPAPHPPRVISRIEPVEKAS
jgi:O-antigen/teichoic acid export membrane protein/glycosyltransferase involved in cell wall biosynthesis